MTTYYSKPKSPAALYFKFSSYKNTITKNINHKPIEIIEEKENAKRKK